MPQCIYCQKEFNLLTKDHFPQQNLFDDKKNIPFRTVPSYHQCNNSFSMDEEYFRNLLVNLSLGTSVKAMDLFNGKITRAYKRKPSQHTYWWSQMSLVQFKTSNGFLLDKRTKVNLSQAWPRIQNVLTKYVKATLFYECNLILDSTVTITHNWGNDQDIELMKSLCLRVIDKDVFAYAFNVVPSTTNSVVASIFFDSVFFLSFVMDTTLQSLIEKKSRENHFELPRRLYPAGPNFLDYRKGLPV